MNCTTPNVADTVRVERKKQESDKENIVSIVEFQVYGVPSKGETGEVIWKLFLASNTYSTFYFFPAN